jgi:hypothetical protein
MIDDSTHAVHGLGTEAFDLDLQLRLFVYIHVIPFSLHKLSNFLDNIIIRRQKVIYLWRSVNNMWNGD